MEALQDFTFKFKKERDFKTIKEADQCLLDIMSHLSSSSWSASCEEDKLILFSCLRLLMRDGVLLGKFISNSSALVILLQELQSATHSYLSSTDKDSSLIIELTNIVQKLSHAHSSHSALIDCGSHKQLLFLLSAHSTHLLQSSINSLVNLGKKQQGRKAILDCYPIDSLLHILETNGVNNKEIQNPVSDLLLLLSQDGAMRQQAKEQDLLSTCLSLLQFTTLGPHVKGRLLEMLDWIMDDEELMDEFRELGGIPVILIHISPQSVCLRESLDDVRILKASLSLLTRLSLNDINAKQIIESNGLYLISHYLVQVEGDRELKLYCLRAMRYLFSLERNRRILKIFFPLPIFEKFISIGHYVHNLSAYSDLAQSLSELSDDEKLALTTNQKSLNHTSCPLRVIGEYEVLELLGTGAYGSVYKVRKGPPRGSNFYALKEIQMTHPSLAGCCSLEERNGSIGKIMSEVSMIHKQLRHPNIVQYFKCFEESHHLYIEMSLIEGTPLSEFISSMKEKKTFFSEKRIWTIFSQIVRGLRYIHEDKGITHRDLKPANMILGEHDKLTITDFGLAKDQKDFSVMKSVVGTVVYWCPEIVESKEYDKKADIWAAGCVLYEMAALQPPFYATNLLSLAKKIAEGKFETAPLDKYSAQVSDVITKCLTIDPALRPNSVQIGGMIAEHLMVQLDGALAQIENKSNKESLSRRSSDAVEISERNVLISRRRLSFTSTASASDCEPLDSTAGSVQDISPYNTPPVRGNAWKRETSPLLTAATTPNKQDPLPSEPIVSRQRSFSLSPAPTVRRSRSTRSGSTVITVSPLSLREISDPVSDVLLMMCKLLYINQLSPIAKFEHSSSPPYIIASRYTRAFLSSIASFDAKELKNELWKLATGVHQEVSLLPSLPHLLEAALVLCPNAPSPHTSASNNHKTTYNQLQIFIEEVLKKTNYYSK